MKEKSVKKLIKYKKLVGVLLAITNLLLVGTYIFLVDASVLHASRAKELNGQIFDLTSILADMEKSRLDYIALIDFNFASSIDLVRTESNSYAVVGGEADAVSYLNNE